MILSVTVAGLVNCRMASATHLFRSKERFRKGDQEGPWIISDIGCGTPLRFWKHRDLTSQIKIIISGVKGEKSETKNWFYGFGGYGEAYGEEPVDRRLSPHRLE